MLLGHLVIMRRRWFYHTPAAVVLSAQLKYFNPFNTGVINVVIEFNKFTDCMLFRCDVVIGCECWDGPGQGINPSPHALPLSRCKSSFKFLFQMCHFYLSLGHHNFKDSILICTCEIIIS